MTSNPNIFARFFGVAIHGQTYLNALYLLLAFPLGIFYFVFLVTGISLGVPLLIVWIGLVILLAVFLVWYGLVAFERQMAIWMLQEQIPPLTHRDLSGMSLWQKFTSTLGNPVTWKGLVYLLAKFPLGILSFTVLVSLVALSASLIGAPFYYHWVHAQINLGGTAVWVVSTLPEALVLCLVGIFVALISMHILNGLAWVSGRFARLMLGNFSTLPAAPAEPSVPVAPSAPEAAPLSDTPGTVA
jgi:Putative sensor